MTPAALFAIHAQAGQPVSFQSHVAGRIGCATVQAGDLVTAQPDGLGLFWVTIGIQVEPVGRLTVDDVNKLAGMKLVQEGPA